MIGRWSLSTAGERRHARRIGSETPRWTEVATNCLVTSYGRNASTDELKLLSESFWRGGGDRTRGVDDAHDGPPGAG